MRFFTVDLYTHKRLVNVFVFFSRGSHYVTLRMQPIHELYWASSLFEVDACLVAEEEEEEREEDNQHTLMRVMILALKGDSGYYYIP